jgi:hypothetical protein
MAWSSSARAAEAVVTAEESVVRTEPYEAAPELVRLHAGDKVTALGTPWFTWRRVRLPDGRKGMVHDADIQVRVTATPATAEVRPQALAPQPTPSPTSGGVFVDIRTTSPYVRIDRVDAGGLLVPVCQVPCRQVLPRNAVYFIDGYGAPFKLPNDKQQVTLDVKAGSTGQKVGGWALIVLGSLSAIASGFIAAATLGCAHAEEPVPIRCGDDAHTLAIGLLYGGFTALGVGVGLIADAGPSVTTSDGVTLVGTGVRPRRRPALALTPRGLEF